MKGVRARLRVRVAHLLLDDFHQIGQKILLGYLTVKSETTVLYTCLQYLQHSNNMTTAIATTNSEQQQLVNNSNRQQTTASNSQLGNRVSFGSPTYCQGEVDDMEVLCVSSESLAKSSNSLLGSASDGNMTCACAWRGHVWQSIPEEIRENNILITRD